MKQRIFKFKKYFFIYEQFPNLTVFSAWKKRIFWFKIHRITIKNILGEFDMGKKEIKYLKAKHRMLLKRW